MFHAAVTSGEVVAHHTKHRSARAAARALSRAITLAQRLPELNCGVVTDTGVVMSLRRAQGKSMVEVDIGVVTRLRRAVGAA